VRNGRTIGCFQIESPGMRATLREIQASTVDDVMVALALYRPGPLIGGLKDAFVRRHLGQEEVEHLHPAFEPLLEDTYGVILYQEQVLRIANELAGLSLAEADLLRRAMSHFDPGKQMQTLKEKFIAGALAHRNVSPEIGQRVWEMMAAFAGYGFPKAHAASYAQLAWRSAWCKTHHPAEFMAAVLANWGGYYSQQVYLMEARRLGLTLRAPHINHSLREFSVQYISGQPILFMGLDQVRDLTRRTQHQIIRERPFNSLDEFLVRVDPRPVEAENLVRVGALNGLGSIPQLIRSLQRASWQSGQYSLFSVDKGKIGDAWSPEQIAAAQETILGASVDWHPLELFAQELGAQGVLSTLDAVMQPGKRVRVAGMRQTWRRFTLSSGEKFYNMSLEDLEGSLRVVIPATVYRRDRAALKERGPYIIEGRVEMDPGAEQAHLRAEKIWRLVRGS
jgi:DNA polymerase III alpha subunit